MSEPHWDEMEPRERDGWIAWKLFGWRWVGVLQEASLTFPAVRYALSPPAADGRAIYPASLIREESGEWPNHAEMFSDWWNMSYSDPPIHEMRFLPRYSTDVGHDFEVLKLTREWIEGDRYQHYTDFYDHLSEILTDRIPYYNEAGNLLDLCHMRNYQPGDFSHAMYLTLTKEG